MRHDFTEMRLMTNQCCLCAAPPDSVASSRRLGHFFKMRFPLWSTCTAEFGGPPRGMVNYELPRGRHGFDGSCRGPKACRDPPTRNRVEQHNWQLTVGTRSLT